MGILDHPLQGNSLRFFNSGVEVGHNGTPVSSHPTPPSHVTATTTTPQSSLSSGVDHVDVTTVDLGNADTTARVGRGMPSFSIGGLLGSRVLPTTPSTEVLEAGPFRGVRDEANTAEQGHGTLEK